MEHAFAIVLDAAVWYGGFVGLTIGLAALYGSIHFLSGRIRKRPSGSHRGRAAISARAAGGDDGMTVFGPCGTCRGRHATGEGASICAELEDLDRSLGAWLAEARHEERRGWAEREGTES